MIVDPSGFRIEDSRLSFVGREFSCRPIREARPESGGESHHCTQEIGRRE